MGVQPTVANRIYRPDEAQALRIQDIPQWEETFYQSRIGRWLFLLAHDPRGEAPATLGGRDQCDEMDCEDLDEQELQELWRTASHKFDGIMRRNGYVYFYRSPINDDTPSDLICKNERAVTLDESLTRVEAVVIELWTSLSESIGFAACAIEHGGVAVYRTNVSDEKIYTKVKTGLDNLKEALEWRQQHPSAAENPHNPHRLPLDISPEKVKAIRDDFFWADRKEEGLIVGGIAFAFATVVQLYHLFGAPSHLYGEEWRQMVRDGFNNGNTISYILYNLWRTWGGGPPTGGDSGGNILVRALRSIMVGEPKSSPKADGTDGAGDSNAEADSKAARLGWLASALTAITGVFAAVDAEMQAWAETSHDYWKDAMPAIATGLAAVAAIALTRGAIVEAGSSAGSAHAAGFSTGITPHSAEQELL